MGEIYSKRQRELLGLWQRDKLKRINILEGSVRSGKTWISLVLWAFWVATMPRDGCYLMAAKTVNSLKRNCLDLLQGLVGEGNFGYSVFKKEGKLFGRTIYLEGAGDMRAESKIRGMTLAGAYCDELSLFEEAFFAMLLSRLSVPGAKLFATTNPDNPQHWLKRGYLERQEELDLLSMRFLIEDNPFLDEGYVQNLKREYTGVFYERFIRGKWVVAEGLVYPMFERERHVVKAKETAQGMYYVSVDYGTVNPCSMGLWQVQDRAAVRLKEYYHDGKKSRMQKTDEEYYVALEHLAGDRVIQHVVVDPSAASFIQTIHRHGRFGVKKAENHVLDGIRVTASLMESGRVLFDESCVDAIREFGLYAWEDQLGEDKVVKEFDHAMDEIRYFCNTVLRREFKWEDWAVKV